MSTTKGSVYPVLALPFSGWPIVFGRINQGYHLRQPSYY